MTAKIFFWVVASIHLIPKRIIFFTGKLSMVRRGLACVVPTTKNVSSDIGTLKGQQEHALIKENPDG